MKKVAHKFAFLKNSSYICTVAEGLRRDIIGKRYAIPYL